MTAPIIPGPFSFLEGAGEAAGSYAQIKEERKRHGEEIAHQGITDLLGQIKQGLRPASVLADPEVKKLFKTAYGVSIPDVLLPQPQEAIQARTAEAVERTPKGSAAERALTGVPSEPVAAAGEAQQVVKGKKAQAEIDRGVPDLEAEAESLDAQAKAAGHQFNASVYKTAAVIFGTDPKFRRLAVEAATGVMDYKIRLLILQKENLSLERQMLADDARITSDLIKDADKYYNQTLATWQSNKLISPDQEAYESNHPKPDQQQEIAKFIKIRTGRSIEQFNDHIQHVMDRLMSPDVTGTKRTHPGGAAPPPKPGDPTPEDKLAKLYSKQDPAKAADDLAAAVEENSITDLQARKVLDLLRESQPASWYRTFNRVYSGRALSK